MAAVAKKSPQKTPARASIPQVDWSQARAAPVVLISGPEAFLADRANRAIRDELRAADPSVEVTEVDAAGYAAGEIFTLASPSLFGEPRLIRIAAVEKCSDDFIADMRRYLAEPAEDTTLVLRHGGGQRGKAVLDLIRGGAGGGIEVLCAEVKKDADRFAFAQAEFRRLGAQIAPGALRMLGMAFTGDLAELAAACGQLVADAGDRISEDTVERYYAGKVQTSAFKVADAAVAGRSGDALVLLRHALESGTDPIPLLAAINMKVRGMARVFGVRGNSGQLAKQLSMAPWQIDRAMQDSRGWRETDLAACIELAAETEWQLKGGGRDPRYALEQYVLAIARRGRPLAA